MYDDGSELALVAAKTEADEPGLYGFRTDGETGALDRVSSARVGESPKFLAHHPDGRHCYVVDRTDGGSVAAVEIDRETGGLSVLNRAPTGDDGPCYCSVDATGRFVLVAHYSGGSVSVLPIDAVGRVGEPTDVVEHTGSGTDPDRQEAPHPHSVEMGPDNRFAYVPDLGTDRVYVYELSFDTDTLRPAERPHVAVHDGAGPRHLDFGPDGAFVYVVTELDSTLTTLARDPETGALTTVGTAGMLPDDFRDENVAADVHVHPSGEWVYASNRGHDSIAIFEIDEDGEAHLVGHEPTGGSWPRDFAIDPAGRFLYAENQNDDEVVVFWIDDATGELTPTGDVVELPRPGCMAFASAE